MIPKKFKADTDHKNSAFVASLRQRTTAASVTNFQKIHKQQLQTMSQGRLPKARIEVPEGFEVHPYGN